MFIKRRREFYECSQFKGQLKMLDTVFALVSLRVFVCARVYMHACMYVDLHICMRVFVWRAKGKRAETEWGSVSRICWMYEVGETVPFTSESSLVFSFDSARFSHVFQPTRRGPPGGIRKVWGHGFLLWVPYRWGWFKITMQIKLYLCWHGFYKHSSVSL